MLRSGRFKLVERLLRADRRENRRETWLAIDEASLTRRTYAIVERDAETQRLDLTLLFDETEVPPSFAGKLEAPLPDAVAQWIIARIDARAARASPLNAVPATITSPTAPETERVLSKVIPAVDTEPRDLTARTVRALPGSDPKAQVLPIPAGGTLSAPARSGVQEKLQSATLSSPERDGVADQTMSKPITAALHDPADDQARTPSVVVLPVDVPTPAALRSPSGVGPALTWIAAFVLFAGGTALLALAARDYLRTDLDPLPAPTKARAALAVPAHDVILELDHPATWTTALRRERPAAAPVPGGPRKRVVRAPRVREEAAPPVVMTEPPPPPPPPPPRAGIGRLNIVVRAAGRSIPLLVYIDGRPTDQAPLQLDLASGVHDVEVRPEKGAPIAKKITVKPDETTRVVLEVP